MSPRLPRTALSALALVALAAPVRADSDGYYCASPGVLAWQVAFSGGPDGRPPRDSDGGPAHRLYIIRYGPGIGLPEPVSVDLPAFQSHGMRCGQDTVHVAGWEAVHAVALSGPGAPRIAEVRAHPPGQVPEGYHEQGNLGTWYRGPWDAGRAWIPLPAPAGSGHTWRIGLALDISVRCRDMPLRSWLEQRTEAGALAGVQPLLTGSVPTQCEHEPDPTELAVGLLRTDGVVVPVGRLVGGTWLPPTREPRERWHVPTESGVVAARGLEAVRLDDPYTPWGQRTDAAGPASAEGFARVHAVALSEPHPVVRVLPAAAADPDRARVVAWLEEAITRMESEALEGDGGEGQWALGLGFPAAPEERAGRPLEDLRLRVGEDALPAGRLWGVQAERRYPWNRTQDPNCFLRTVVSGHVLLGEGPPRLLEGGVTLTDCDGKNVTAVSIEGLLEHEGEVWAIGEAWDWDGGEPGAWRLAGERLTRVPIPVVEP